MYDNIFCCPICQVKGPLYVDATITAALACLPSSVPKIAFTESGRFMAVEHQQVVEQYLNLTFQNHQINTILSIQVCYLLYLATRMSTRGSKSRSRRSSLSVRLSSPAEGTRNRPVI